MKNHSEPESHKIYPKNFVQSFLLVLLVMLIGFLILYLDNLFFSNSNNSEIPRIFIRDFLSYFLAFVLVHLISNRSFVKYNFSLYSIKIIFLVIIIAVMLDISIGIPLYHFIPKPYFMSVNVDSLNWQILLSSLILAPVFEELIMRGIILDGLLKSKSAIYSIAITTILFILIHLDLAKIPILLTSGVLLGWVYYKTRSLAIVIIIHIVNNSTSFSEIYLFEELRRNKENLFSVYGEYTILTIMISLLILVISLFSLSKILKKKDGMKTF